MLLTTNTATADSRIGSHNDASGVMSCLLFARVDCSISLLCHERILVVQRRRERLLDRPRAHPPYQIQLGASLVVRSRPTRAAERLLADDGTGGLVVHIEVPGRIAQCHRCLAHGAAIVREYRT